MIDAAYGTGFHGTWSPPDVGDTPVLAVDVPSGVDALTGDIAGDVLAATRTVTFAALKPGLLMPPGSALAGELELADIGLDVGWARANLVQAADVVGWWPERDEYAHKWQQRGAGHRRQLDDDRRAAIGCPRGHAHRGRHGAPVDPRHDADRRAHRDRPAAAAQHVVGRRRAWRRSTGSTRSSSGPGSVDPTTPAASVRKLVVEAPLPMVIDGDGLFALGWSSEGAAALLRRRSVPDRADSARRRVRACCRAASREPTGWSPPDGWRPTAAAPCC